MYCRTLWMPAHIGVKRDFPGYDNIPPECIPCDTMWKPVLRETVCVMTRVVPPECLPCDVTLCGNLC